MQFKSHLLVNEDGLNYFPIIHFNDFWLLRDKHVAVNDTLSNITIHLELGTLSTWWWQLQMQVKGGLLWHTQRVAVEANKMQVERGGEGQEGVARNNWCRLGGKGGAGGAGSGGA